MLRVFHAADKDGEEVVSRFVLTPQGPLILVRSDFVDFADTALAEWLVSSRSSTNGTCVGCGWTRGGRERL